MSLVGIRCVSYTAVIITLATILVGCAGTRSYSHYVSLTVRSSPPNAVISYKDDSAEHGRAPALIYYSWDPKFVSDGCLRTKGLKAVWSDGNTRATEDVVTLCDPGKNHELTITGRVRSKTRSSRVYTLCPDGTRVKGPKCFKMFDGTYEGE